MALPATNTLPQAPDPPEKTPQEAGELVSAPDASRPSLAARGGVKLIRFYQTAISPLTPPSCRFRPTCSQYTLEAIKRHGFLRGVWLGTLRILKCHPLHPGGHDPVP